MANLGVPAEVTEYQDPPEVLQKKIRQLAGLIKQVRPANTPHAAQACMTRPVNEARSRYVLSCVLPVLSLLLHVAS